MDRTLRLRAAVVVLGFLLGAACGAGDGPSAASPSPSPSVTATSELASYHNEDEGFSIGYPGDWTREEDAFGAVVAFADPEEASAGFAPNLSVVIEDLPSADVTQDQYTEAALEHLRSGITNFGDLEQASATLSGRPATEVTYTGTQGKFDLRWLQVYTVVEDRAFVVTFVALPDQFDSVEPTVRQMIASFRLD